jgi:hypothetical protein
MTFSKFSAFALPALSIGLAGCASSAPRKDPYAQASAAKRLEIDRLSKRIDSLRVLPASEAIDRQLDSLRGLRSLEAGNLQGLGQASRDNSARDTTQKILDFDHEAQRVIDENKKYPIQKP